MPSFKGPPWSSMKSMIHDVWLSLPSRLKWVRMKMEKIWIWWLLPTPSAAENRAKAPGSSRNTPGRTRGEAGLCQTKGGQTMQFSKSKSKPCWTWKHVNDKHVHHMPGRMKTWYLYVKELSVPRFHEVQILVMICAYGSISNASLLHKPIYINLPNYSCWMLMITIFASNYWFRCWIASMNSCMCLCCFSCLDVQQSSISSRVVIWSPCGRAHGSVSWVWRKIAARSFFRVFL